MLQGGTVTPFDRLHPALKHHVVNSLGWADLRPFQQAVIDGRTRLAVRQWLEQGRLPRGLDVPGLLRLIFAAAPLSRVMLRGTPPPRLRSV